MNEPIVLFKPFMASDAPERVAKVLMSGYIGQGPVVEEFETAIGKFINVPKQQVVTVNSGTEALRLALHLAGVRFGDTVVSTPMTCLPTNSVILEAGAKIEWADIEPWSGRIDVSSIKLALKRAPHAKALMIMDWGGTPCDLHEIRTLADNHGVMVIEDSAHSFGAQYKGLHMSHYADFVCHSFQAIKHLTTGDGGAVICKKPRDADRARLLRWFGIDRSNPTKNADLRCEADVVEAGYKMHMNDIAAAIGLANIEHTEKILFQQSSNASFFNQALSGVFDLSIMNCPSDRLSACWLYTVTTFDQAQRDRLFLGLKERGIMSSKVHARNDLHTCLAAFRKPLPGVDRFFATQLSIPVGWWLTEEELNRVADAVKSIMAGK